MNKKINIALVASQGGHSGQIKIIFNDYVIGKNNVIFITETPYKDKIGYGDNLFLGKYRTYLFEKDILLKLNPYSYLKTMLKLKSIFKEEKIDIIVTNGAQLSIAAVLAAKLLGIKVIFLDTFIRVKTPNWSARFCYYFSDLFLVQHENMRKKYGKKAICRGSVL